MAKIKNLFLLEMVFILFALLSTTAIAQNPEKQIRIEQDKRQELEKTELKILEGEDRLLFDYGGWINFRYDDYKNDNNDSTSRDSLDYSLSVDARFWMKFALKPPTNASYDNEHSVYIRFKDIYEEKRPLDTNESYDNDGPHLDYGYLLLDLNPYQIEIGRRYFTLGQGIAYGNVNDGIKISLSLQNWELKGTVSRTLPHEENIDLSIPGYDKESKRTYYGLEVTYLGIPNQGLYGYYLVQRDNSDELPNDLTRDYTYDSEYIGLGVQGKIISNMHYWAEIIRETGKSHIYAPAEKKDISAWAGDFGITYDLDIYSNPNFTFEYAFGSGDSSRDSVTDTQNGNTSNHDNNFLYFGYIPTGYALSPRLSNLHFFKIGVLLKPLERYDLFRNLTIGIDYYRFFKDKSKGGIYDAEATVNNNDIGDEIDLTLSWQIFSDLSCTLEYGYFKPGDAYPDSTNDSENYFSLSTTLTF